MGDKMKKNSIKKILIFLLICGGLAFETWKGYPFFKKFIRHNNYSISYYNYKPAKPVVSEVNTSIMPPARAVPVLIYHGVTYVQDADNTSLDNFIKQMEMLKRNGYQTITLEKFDDFLDGKATLPPRPIIITFDDGRKDSYYTTDDIFKKLGFNAVLFEVSGKPDSRDQFYLSWNELKEMKDSGRWDIQSHGTYSHERFPIDDKGRIGWFLSFRRYDSKTGLESIKQYQARVEDDYHQNIYDLENNLGIVPQYYAIPLNDYGQQVPSNYPEAIDFNTQLIKKLFRLAFVQVSFSEDINQISPSIFNYRDANRYRIGRIEVKNLDADLLKRILEANEPREANFSYDFTIDHQADVSIPNSYGIMDYKKDGLYFSAEPTFQTGRLIIGDLHWKNYYVEAKMRRISGRSLSLIGYFEDNDNYVLFGLTDNGLFLREYVKGKEIALKQPILYEYLKWGSHVYRLEFMGSTVTAKIDGRVVFKDVVINEKMGRAGFKIWSDTDPSNILIENLKIGTIL